VLYFESYVVIDPGMTTLEHGQLLTDEQYYEAMEEYGDEFTAEDGRRGRQDLMKQLDLEVEIARLREEIPRPTPRPRSRSCPSASS
jgi:DNA-directed RNA polymerase subunit beta'